MVGSTPYRPIAISHENGSAEGYVASSGAENVANFLEREVGPEVGKRALEILKTGAQRVAVLKSVNVDEESRGQGVGSDIVGRFFDATENVDAILLIADSCESQAEGFNLESFYEGFDFEKVCDTPSGPLMVFPIDLAKVMREHMQNSPSPRARMQP